MLHTMVPLLNAAGDDLGLGRLTRLVALEKLEDATRLAASLRGATLLQVAWLQPCCMPTLFAPFPLSCSW
jgi:hypothetical protein